MTFGEAAVRRARAWPWFLWVAVRLRELTREAIDRGDDHAMCALNRRADAARRDLWPIEDHMYSAWINAPEAKIPVVERRA